MSRLFNRVVRIEVISDGQQVTFEGLRMQFYVYKSRSDTPNETSVRVYNANPDNRRAALETGATVRVLAGYDTPVLLSQAQATSAFLERTPPDTIVQIECQDGIDELRSVRVSLSFERGATARQVLDAISAQLGFPLRPIEVDLNIPMRGGYSHVGGVGTCLDDICGRAGANWSVQNGDLMVLGADGKNPGEVFLISPQTGLLNSPQKLQSDLDTLNVGGPELAGYKLQCLLLPQLEPGDQIVLEAADVPRGTFVIDDVEHTGDTEGPEFFTALTVFEVTA